MKESDSRCSAAWPSRAGLADAVGWREAKPFLFLREGGVEAASAHSSRELRGLLKSPFRRLARVGKVRSGDPGLPRLVWARVTSVQRSAFPSPAGEGPRVGVTSAEEPAPRAVAWGRRGGAREPGRKGRAGVLVPVFGAWAGARQCARRRGASRSGRCRVRLEGR